MFYTQNINIINKDTGNILKSIKSDVQPISDEAKYFQYGYTQSISFRIYCNSDSLIELGTVIQYKNNCYEIMKVLDWGTYTEILVEKYNGTIGGGTPGGDTW